MEENLILGLVLQPNVLGGRFRETEPNRTVAMLYVAKFITSHISYFQILKIWTYFLFEIC